MNIEIEMEDGYPVITKESESIIKATLCPVCGRGGLFMAHGIGWDESRLYCLYRATSKSNAPLCSGDIELTTRCEDCNGKGCEECNDGQITVSTYPRGWATENI